MRRASRVYARFLLSSAGVVVSAVTLLHIIEFVLDPLYLHGPVPPMAHPPRDIRFAAPGLIRNLEYDAVLVGSSITRNLPRDELDRAVGGRVLVLAMPGTSAFEQGRVARMALREKPLRRVFWEVTMLTFRGEPTRLKYVDFPGYLYDEARWNDLGYLLSPDGYLLVWQKVGAIVSRAAGRDVWSVARSEHPIRPVDSDSVLEAGCTALYYMSPPPFVASEYTTEHFLENLRENVLPLVDRHPDVEFVLYMPPLHVSFYNVLERVSPGFLDRYTTMKLRLYAMAARRSNVRLVDFEDHFDVVTDFSRYVDTQHHEAGVASYIARHLLDEPHRVKREEMADRLERFRARVVREMRAVEPALEAHCQAERDGLEFCRVAYRSFEAAMVALGRGRREAALRSLARAIEVEDRGLGESGRKERGSCGFMRDARRVHQELERSLSSRASRAHDEAPFGAGAARASEASCEPTMLPAPV